jgi:Tfp pilus assembly protein PilV
MVRQRNSGQSLVEVVISVGVIVLVLTAVVSLIVSSLHSRTVGYDRQKAAEIGQRVVEYLVEEKQANPDDFWDIGSTAFWQGINLGTTQSMVNYPGYNYAIDFTQVISVGNSPCPAVPMKCANATIGVVYTNSNSSKVTFTRFFSR